MGRGRLRQGQWHRHPC